MRSALGLARATRPAFSAAYSTSTASSSAHPVPAAAPTDLESVQEPAPSSSSSTTPFLPGGQASASTLDSLVSLHHTASTFMHDPSEVRDAFQTAFEQEARYLRYENFATMARESAAARPHGGLHRLGERGRSLTSMGARRATDNGELLSWHDNAVVHRDIWRARARSWTQGRDSMAHDGLSEREMRVKEALLGTWERGDSKQPQPGLVGVVEVLEARGTSVQESAREWGGEQK